MKVIKNIYWFLFFLFKPSYWLMNDPYSEVWDKKLNKLMSNNKFEEPEIKTGYTAMIGGVEVWIGNHPYASFTPCEFMRGVRPSRKTIYMAQRKLLRDLFNGQ